MKSFQIPMLAMSLVGLGLFSGLDAPAAHAGFTFGEPVNLRSVFPVLDPVHEGINSFSPDGLEMYIESDRPGGYGGGDLWVMRRASIGENWGTPANLGSVVNSAKNDSLPCISADGLTLYFNSDRPGGYGKWDLYVTTRLNKNRPWGTPVNLGPYINSSADDCCPWLSTDGLELYFHSSKRPGGYGDQDIYVVRRPTDNDPWSDVVNLGPLVNSAYADSDACLSADGLVLFFSGTYFGPVRPGGHGGSDVWMTRRASRADTWQAPVNLGVPVNSPAHDCMLRISPDGSAYFSTYDAGTWENWRAPILPICDFNVDGIVDIADVGIMIEHWYTDDPLCDIGPMPWGDGFVDTQDLIVLAEHLFEIYPSAETVDVNDANDGGQIELELGKLLVVTLESNPSTGYRWELVENNESILKHFGQTEFKPSETSDPPIVGAGGWEIFRFKAVSAGQMTLELVYHRSWEDAEPLNTFSIQLTVN